jgi:hypothetical protein
MVNGVIYPPTPQESFIEGRLRRISAVAELLSCSALADPPKSNTVSI